MNDIVTTMNSDKALCCSFGLYPSYVAGILNCAKEINFYVSCSEMLNYADYFEKCIADKVCIFNLPTDYDFNVVTEQRFQLIFGGGNYNIY